MAVTATIETFLEFAGFKFNLRSAQIRWAAQAVTVVLDPMLSTDAYVRLWNASIAVSVTSA